MAEREHDVRLEVEGRGEVSAHWRVPATPRAVIALAHGAGNDMNHAFMRRAQAMFAALDVACLRFNFPYKELGKKAPDRPPVLLATWRAAIAHTLERHPRLTLIAGGKSMGGRIASMLASEDSRIDALVLLGYPLHPAGKPERERAEHFASIRVPSLFVQGTRDRLCDLDRLRVHLKRLGDEATVHVVEDGDHSFKVPKRSALDEDAVWDGIEQATSRWLRRL